MPKPKPIRTTLYFPPELWKQCRLEAVKHNTTATEIVVRAVEAYLGGMKSGAASVAAKATRNAAQKAAKEEAIEKQQKQFSDAIKGFAKGFPKFPRWKPIKRTARRKS